MKKIFLVLAFLWGISSIAAAQTFEPLTIDGKKEFSFRIEGDNFYLRVDDPSFEVKAKNLMIHTDDYGYVNLSYGGIVHEGDFTIITYKFDGQKSKFKGGINNIILETPSKTYYPQIDIDACKRIHDALGFPPQRQQG